MYFVYDYNVVDCKPEEEIDKYHNPLNKIICEETIRLGGSMVHHHGIGKHRVHWSKLEHGSAWAFESLRSKVYSNKSIVSDCHGFNLCSGRDKLGLYLFDD